MIATAGADLDGGKLAAADARRVHRRNWPTPIRSIDAKSARASSCREAGAGGRVERRAAERRRIARGGIARGVPPSSSRRGGGSGSTRPGSSRNDGLARNDDGIGDELRRDGRDDTGSTSASSWRLSGWTSNADIAWRMRPSIGSRAEPENMSFANMPPSCTVQLGLLPSPLLFRAASRLIAILDSLMPSAKFLLSCRSSTIDSVVSPDLRRARCSRAAS